MSDISSIISSIQKIMRKDEWVDGDAQRIGQLSWMLFLKIFDDKEKQYEITKDNYKSPMPDEFKWRNWAANPEWITWDELRTFVDEKLFNHLKNIKVDPNNPMSYIVRNVFEDAHNYMKSWVIMRQVINKLAEIDFNKKTELHIFNDIYEKVLNDLQWAGNAWEFYTPRAVTHFMVDMISPKLGEKVLDPACGTAGFLTWSIEYIRDKYVNTPEEEEILQNNIFWFELKQLPHLLATTNLILHGIEVPVNLKRFNSLSRSLKDISADDMVDVIMTNPPFGWTIQPGILHNFPAQFQTQETASLFMVMIMNLLKNNGRAWVVLPDWFLFSEWVDARIKEKLLTDCNLHTIVRLPTNVFAPYATVATNLLFFTKGEPTKEIWYYEHKVPEWQKTYNKTNPIKLSEFEWEKARWNNKEESDVSWKIDIEDIRARNFNLDFKNPNRKEVIQEFSTQQLIQKIEWNFTEAQSILTQIKKSL